MPRGEFTFTVCVDLGECRHVIHTRGRMGARVPGHTPTRAPDERTEGSRDVRLLRGHLSPLQEPILRPPGPKVQGEPVNHRYTGTRSVHREVRDFYYFHGSINSTMLIPYCTRTYTEHSTIYDILTFKIFITRDYKNDSVERSHQKGKNRGYSLDSSHFPYYVLRMHFDL